jgi:hypothetical protein
MNVTTLLAADVQRMRALGRANEVRNARATAKRQIAEGRISAAEVILSPTSEFASMDVFAVLMSQRSWGRVRSLRVLESVPLPEAKTVGSMTDRQRRLLADRLIAEGQPHARALSTQS